MAFSGTVSQTTFTTRRVIENAVRRCKLPAEQISSETVDIAKDQLFLMLSDWGNTGLQLWTVEKQIYPLYSGVAQIALTLGTIDILNSSLRLLQRVTGADATTGTTFTTAFGTATQVTSVGILWTGASVPVALERSDDGATWTTVQTETPTAIAGQWTWFDLASVVASAYFRVRATSGALSVSSVYLGNTPTEIPLARLSRDDYTNLPNKSFQSNRPLQYWFDRQVRQPIMHMWPVPNDAATVQQIIVWRQRQIMDVGSLTQEIEVPQRWYEAVVAGLAAKLALELIDVDGSLVPMLDQKAAIALQAAQDEERDNSPIMIAPNISMYTR